MIWNGNECGKKLRATILSTDCDRSNLENVEYFSCLGTMITNGASCTQGTKSCTVVVKAAMNKKQKTLFTSKLGIKIKE